MRFIITSWRGLLFLVLLMGINALLWFSAASDITQTFDSTMMQMMASNIIIVLTFNFFLATKNPLVNWLFQGLENVYLMHRLLAFIVLIMIFLHSQNTHLIIQDFNPNLFVEAGPMGPWARNLLIFLIVLALLANYMKYEHFRLLHRLMIIPYLMAVYHAFFISSYELMAFSFLGIFMMALVLTGISSSVYMMLLYRKHAFKYQGTIENISHPADDVTELEVKMHQAYAFKTGQFAFVKIDKAPFNASPHPFSISGVKNGHIYFTIKALGDFTQDIKTHIKESDTITLTKPFGHMTFDDYPNKQVWLAGGIGITPFLSHLRSQSDIKQDITLYYSVKQKKEAVHLPYLTSLAQKYPNFTLKFSESDKDGFLNLDKIDLKDNPTVFLCGPVPMAKALKKAFRKTDQHQAFVFEAFSFTGTLAQDIEGLIKRLYRKLKAKKNTAK